MSTRDSWAADNDHKTTDWTTKSCSTGGRNAVSRSLILDDYFNYMLLYINVLVMLLYSKKSP